MRTKLRHPIRAIREPFGTAGLIVAVVALVAALAGGAYAAGGLSGKQKKEVEKIAKKYAGKPGAAGAQGPAGANGAAGAAGQDGLPGADGAPGKTGPAGPAGANGKSVTLSAAGACATGGTKLTVGTENAEVCNGAKGDKGDPGIQGPKGDPGDPWTAGGTLPSGATETGGWSFSGLSYATTIPPENPLELRKVRDSISFNVPLASPLPESKVQVNPVGFPSGATATEIEICPGSAANPKAKKGFFCLYTGFLNNVTTAVPLTVNKLEADEAGASTAGAVLEGTAEVGEPEELIQVGGRGSWAVTAP